METADRKEPAAPSTLLSLELVGVDHPGIIHDISSALAERDVSIEELETETKNAPMAWTTSTAVATTCSLRDRSPSKHSIRTRAVSEFNRGMYQKTNGGIGATACSISD